MRRLSAREQARVRELHAEGLSGRAIARVVGRSAAAVTAVLVVMAAPGEVAPGSGFVAGPGRLGPAEREEIALGMVRGESFAVVARRLGRAPSTVSREVAANGGRGSYRGLAAQRRARARAARPKISKLAACPALAAVVSEGLSLWWSPQQIAAQLLLDFPDDPMMRVSHETIYQSLFVQGRGSLRKELAGCLRSGRAVRRPQGHVELRGRIPDMVMISERPAEAADRAVPGHWEGDLIIGKNGRSAVGTLVERATRYVMLLHLPDDHTAAAVRAAMNVAIARLPEALWRSVTWDQGAEMAQHAQFKIDTGIQIYFCDPHSPWQRGSNENTNGLLRQWMPKGTDLRVHTPEDLAEFERLLNGRPRQTLGWAKPYEKLAEAIALTA